MKVSVVYASAPRQVRQWALALTDGATVAQALDACHFFSEFPALSAQSLMLGIWSKRADLRRVLRDGDRVEIYRALRVDPKTARRERFSRQGIKRAGLFAGARAGAKAGY